MFRIPRLAAISLALLGVAAVTACSPSTSSAPSQQRSITPAIPQGGFDPNQPVTVAMLSPLTAPNEGAAQLAQALVNAANLAHGRLGDPLMQLKIYDTAGDAAVAAGAAQQAVADGAKLIIGPLFASSAQPVGQVASGAGIRVIAFSTDSTVAGGPVYLSGFLPEKEAARIARFAKAQGYETLGIFYPQNALGEVAAGAMRGAATATGQQIVAEAGYTRTVDGIRAGATDFAAQVQTSGASAVFLPDSGDGLRTVTAFLDYNGVAPGSVKYLGLGQWNSKSTLEEATLAGGWFPSPDPAALRRFVSEYRRAYRDTPPALAVLGYDAVQVAGQMLATARASGSKDPFGDAAITRIEGFQGATGPLRFGPDHLADRAMSILEVGQGSFITVEPAPLSLVAGS